MKKRIMVCIAVEACKRKREGLCKLTGEQANQLVVPDLLRQNVQYPLAIPGLQI